MERFTFGHYLLTASLPTKMYLFRYYYHGLTYQLFLPFVVLGVPACCLDHIKNTVHSSMRAHDTLA